MAAVLKGNDKLLLRTDLVRVIRNPYPDMTVTPWYLIYRNINAALQIVGFSGILDTTTEVKHQAIENQSGEILNLCAESQLARTRLSCCN